MALHAIQSVYTIPDSMARLAEPMSCRQYAISRNLSPMSVSKAIAAGRLKESVIRMLNGQPKIIDPELADQEYNANTDRTRAAAEVKDRQLAEVPPEARQPSARGLVIQPEPAFEDEDESGPAKVDGVTFNEANIREKIAKAKLAELKLAESAGGLVEVSKVQHEIKTRYAEVKSKLLGVPAKARQLMPELSIQQMAKFETLIRESLEALADGN